MSKYKRQYGCVLFETVFSIWFQDHCIKQYFPIYVNGHTMCKNVVCNKYALEQERGRAGYVGGERFGILKFNWC